MGLQVKESDLVRRARALEAKNARLEAQSLRLARRADEREAAAAKTRAAAAVRCRALARAIQGLRRQYAGAVPLAKQEKAAKMLAELNAEKARAAQLLREAEEKADEAETKAEELAVKV